MRILQLDVKSMDYEIIEPEASEYEKAEKGQAVHVDNALVMLTTIERGDDEKLADKAVKEAVEFAKKQKIEKVVLYPFAHLSDSLEPPKKALEIFAGMREKLAEAGLESVYAPFGWNKRWSISIKGHPLAEQSKHFSNSIEAAIPVKPKERRKMDLSIVKKSDWTGLPENDHRSIGDAMELYSYQGVSPSMVYWHPNGYIIYSELKDFMRSLEKRYDYQEISTPAIANIALWHVSGHADHYLQNMFLIDEGADQLGLKPMNCPSTILIYKSRRWSYRELPFRTAIFDKLYRREVSGALSGLFRVQELTQDDGHIFVSEEGIKKEISLLLEMVKITYDTFGLKFYANLSTMPEDHMGDEKLWEKATNDIKAALEENKMAYKIKEKEGAFYGPKIDFDIEDSQGRLWQCATIQLDYQLPLRFEITYTGEDGKEHTPVIIHRAILGSIERFAAVMIEHYQGKLPAWLSPTQAKVISISEPNNKYSEEVFSELKKHNIRAGIDVSNKTLDKKIKEAQQEHVPYMLIIGAKEAESKTVSVRMRSGKQEHGIKPSEFAERLENEVRERANP